MNTIKTLIAIFCTVSLSSAYSAGFQPSGNGTSANTQATATLSAVCTISAQDVKFGNLVLPLSAQSASSSMTVLCSKSAPYTIALAYGGVYGSGTQTVTGTLGSAGNYFNNAWIGGSGISYTQGYCAYNVAGQTDTYYTIAPNLNQSANYGCTSTAQIQIGASYTYGKMNGVMYGDSIAYSIQVPNNSSQVWNTGLGSYSSSGTGNSQSIPIVVNLVPAQSSNNYPSPDTYMDTVTATISY
jgi:spore coat protein U-like protein